MIKRIYLSTLLALLFLTPAAAQDRPAQDSEESPATRLAGVSEAIARDEPDSVPVSIEVFDQDSVEFDLPESMSQNMDSIMNEWYVKNCLYSSDCESSNYNPSFPDSVYADRLSRMQTEIEMPYNAIIRQYIDRYTGRNRNMVSYMLGAANYYMPIFEEALDYYGLPLELKYLPIIESALNPVAVSRAGAKGLWQFMFNTGKLYGLNQTSLIDERLDPMKSAYAAARYLRDLYATFGDWSLAISAYNCGPGGIKKAILRSSGKTDFWEIYPYLPKETRGYLPSFIAACYVMTYYGEHNICPMQPRLSLSTDTLVIAKNLHFEQISALCNIGTDEIKALNPQYIRQVIPGNSQPCILKLPNSAVSAFIAAGDSIYRYHADTFFPKSAASSLTNEELVSLSKAKQSAKAKAKARGTSHKVARGESLGTIAKKYHTTVARLKQINGIKGNTIQAGKFIKIN